MGETTTARVKGRVRGTPRTDRSGAGIGVLDHCVVGVADDWDDQAFRARREVGKVSLMLRIARV